MRVLVVAAHECDSRYAHALNTMKMAQGFARMGSDTAVVCRRPRTGEMTDRKIAEHYQLTESIRTIQLPHWMGTNRLFAVGSLAFVFRWKPDLIYARNFRLPTLSTALGHRTVAESHAHPGNVSPALERLVRCTGRGAFRLLLTISEHLADNFVNLGVPAEKIAVLPDAVDLEQFTRPVNLPPSPYAEDRPRAVYTGHLYDYKGIPTVLEAAELLPQVRFHLVGGLPGDIERQRKRITERGLRNVTVHGYVRQSDLPPYLWHADVLLLPPSANHPSAKWTSPLKLGEYMASGVPFVSSDIAALRDWLTDRETVFFQPDDSKGLANAISQVLEDSTTSIRMVTDAMAHANELSYTERARRILEHPNVGLMSPTGR
jgi:glycosyltransferase involved in cell wall biosynthesis